MSFPFRFKTRPDTFSRLVEHLRSVVERFPDARTGSETVYSMADAALGAFSVFFTQSPSFLGFQRNLQVAKGWADENQPKRTRLTTMIFSCFCSARADKKNEGPAPGNSRIAPIH